jgi:hypothetical protein
VPEFHEWGPPNAPVVAWIAVHFTAVMVLLTTIALADPTAHFGETLIAMLWVAAISGLVMRVVRHIATQPIDHSMERAESPLSSDTKTGLFLVLTQLTYIAMAQVGPEAIGAFFAVLAISVGVRIAGLEAWEGSPKHRFDYVRKVFSLRGFGVLAMVFLIAGLNFGVLYLVTERFPALKADSGWLTPVNTSQFHQWREFVLNVLSLVLPTLALCEMVASIASFHSRLNERLAFQERRAERAEFAVALHDKAINLAGQIRRRAKDPEHQRLARLLERELRELQLLNRTSSERSVEACLETALRFANEYGLHVTVNAEEDALRVLLEPSRASTVESLLLVHIGNSANHAAASATVVFTKLGDSLRFEYFDDAGGFDPEIALRKAGGLTTSRHALSKIGGSLDFDRLNHLTRSRAFIPLR